MEFKNQRYYSLCRYELDKKPSFIYEEVKDLFNHKAITISHIYTWSHQFRNERNEQKRGRHGATSSTKTVLHMLQGIMSPPCIEYPA